MMIAHFFDNAERRIADSSILTTFRQTINADEDVLTVRGYGFPVNAEYVGFFDRANDFRLYHIVEVTENKITHEQTLYCESDLYELVTDKTITDVRPTNTTAGLALTQALDGTRFETGVVESSALASTRFFYCSPFTALRSIESVWSVRAKVRYAIRGAHIVRRYIDLVSTAPVWRGKRFEIGKDILSAEFKEDRRNVVTALTGRGKGESVGDGYGRRISFADVVWSKANGDPADKPAGQEWIENPAATALYGVCGTRPRFAVVEFDDIEDHRELLRATWDALQNSCAPVIYGSLSSTALDAMGFPHEAAYIGDQVAFITEDRRLRAQIVGVEREYTTSGADIFEFGKMTDSSVRQFADVKREINKTKDKASVGAQIAEKNEGLLYGYIDTMKTQILSTGTKLYTDEYDGGLVLESSDGTRAVKLTGSGILIASKKIADEWKWTLAIDGNGIVANTITTGVLNAAIVKIFGTNVFYWDAANINIVNPVDSNRQIRIGLYDGKNYGIGFTLDGGKTWQSAIGFDGVSIKAGSITETMLSPDLGLSGIGTRITEVEQKVTADSIVGTVRTSSEYNEDLSSIESKITQDEKDWTAYFNQIGLAGAQTGITSIDINGLKVTHSKIGGYSQISADGLRMLNATGQLIGGMFAYEGKVYSAVQCLMNPQYPNFRVSVAPSDVGGEQNGMHFIINDVDAGKASAYNNGSSHGLRFDTNGQLGLYAGSLVLSSQQSISESTNGDILYSFYGYNYAGQYTQLSLRASDIWTVVARNLD